MRARGEGSVFKNPERPGTWVAQLRVNGRKVKRTASSEQAAVRLLSRMRRDRDEGRDPTRLTMERYAEQWLDHKRQDGTRINTLRGYESKMRTHVVPHLRSVTLADLTPRHVEDMTRAIIKSGRTAQTAAHVRTVLANALHDAERWGLVDRNVAALAVPPRVDATERTALDVSQVARLFTALEGHEWEAAYMLAAVPAMREGELLALRWQDADLDEGAVRISQTVRKVKGGYQYEPPKTARSRRAIPLPAFVVAALRRRKTRQAEARLACPPGLWQTSDLVFTGPRGEPIAPNSLLRELKAVLDRAGLPIVTVHDLRHSGNSLMAAAGVPARVRADMLGHAHAAFNEDRYTHSFDPALRDAVDRVEAALAAPRRAPRGR